MELINSFIETDDKFLMVQLIHFNTITIKNFWV